MLMPRCRVPLCRAPKQGGQHVALAPDFNILNKSEIKHEIACLVSEIFVPLQCQIEEAERGPLRVEIARIKSGNCAR